MPMFFRSRSAKNVLRSDNDGHITVPEHREDKIKPPDISGILRVPSERQARSNYAYKQPDRRKRTEEVVHCHMWFLKRTLMLYALCFFWMDTFWTPTRLKRIVICQCTITIALLGILLVLVIQWSIKRNTVFHHSEKTVCVPCYQLKWSGNADLTGFEQRNESYTDFMTCCNRMSKVLDRLSEKYAVSNYRKLTSSRLVASACDGCKYGDVKPYVKMTGLNISKMENDIDDIIQWNSTESEGNVKPINGKIFIKKRGFYYVFSTLMYQQSIFTSKKVHTHSIYMHSYYKGGMIQILENSQSFCTTTSDTSEYTSTVGAVFLLEKHDKVFVRNSHPEHLVPSEHSNFFGLYMIQNI